MIKTIFFRVDGDDGKYSGLGHISRTLKFYTFLKKKLNNKFKFVFLSKYKEGINIIKNQTNEKIIRFSKESLKKINFNKNDIVIIDTLGAENFFLKKLNKKKIKKVSFDELDLKNFKLGLIINGILFTKKKIDSKKNIKIYQGTDYLILDKSFSKKKYSFQRKSRFIKKIFICSGGADYKNFLFKITSFLLRYTTYEINVVIGSSVKKNNKIFNLKNKRLNKFYNITNIKALMEKNDIIICTGGTIMFESISTGFKPIVFENYKHQKYAIRYFLNKDQIIYAKKFNDKNISNLDLLINKIDKLNKIRSFKKNTKEIDGKGLFRVNKILIDYING